MPWSSRQWRARWTLRCSSRNHRAGWGRYLRRRLVMVGELDQPDKMSIGEHLAASIPGARLIRLPGVAHLPPMEAPEEFLGS